MFLVKYAESRETSQAHVNYSEVYISATVVLKMGNKDVLTDWVQGVRSSANLFSKIGVYCMRGGLRESNRWEVDTVQWWTEKNTQGLEMYKLQ